MEWEYCYMLGTFSKSEYSLCGPKIEPEKNKAIEKGVKQNWVTGVVYKLEWIL